MTDTPTAPERIWVVHAPALVSEDISAELFAGYDKPSLVRFEKCYEAEAVEYVPAAALADSQAVIAGLVEALERSNLAISDLIVDYASS